MASGLVSVLHDEDARGSVRGDAAAHAAKEPALDAAEAARTHDDEACIDLFSLGV